MAAVIPSQADLAFQRGRFAPREGRLERADFRMIAEPGFGDPFNGYCHSMAWFEGKLYCGTTRATLTGVRFFEPTPDAKPWPVEVPESGNSYDVDRRAEIWCYDPPADRWTCVYRAGEVTGRTMKRNDIPRYMGYRGMTVFQGPSDSKPCLYVSTWAPAQAEPPDVLRSEDGIHFGNCVRPPWGPTVRSFRTLQVFKGRVHTSPTGSNVAGQAMDSVGSETVIYCSDDLQSGIWKAACSEGFGDRNNLTVFEMGTFNGHLYAGTVNPEGLQLWKTDGEGGPPYQWKKVLTHGAYRGPLSEVVVSMCEFKGALYVGTGIVNGGYHRANRVGPGAAEVIRVWPDDSWDLVVGQSRNTPVGMKLPLSGHSAGFDNIFGGYVWRMCAHGEYLYAGTYSWANMLPYLPFNMWPEDVLRTMNVWGIDYLQREYGGVGLFRTHDGVRWEPVTRSGFENKFNWGIRNFASTPYGLFVGTANPFGQRIAARLDGQWQYIDNNRGACEIYLGAPRVGSSGTLNGRQG